MTIASVLAALARPRIDLDGVALADERDPHMIVAIFRYRTTEGLVLLVPESAEVLVPWEHVEQSGLDLRSGALRVRLAQDFVASQNWLRGARDLVGHWMDRLTMRRADAG